MHGCFYHLCSDMWKRIQQSGLHLRMISVLAFLPPSDVQNSFDQLAALICNQYENGADGVLGYFEDHYVGRFRVNTQSFQHFQSIFGICFTAQMTTFQEQIMQLRGGTEGSKDMFLPVILCFGSLTKRGNRCQSGNFTKWRWPRTSSTKKKIRWLQPAYPQNCRWLPKSSKNWLFKKYSS